MNEDFSIREILFCCPNLLYNDKKVTSFKDISYHRHLNLNTLTVDDQKRKSLTNLENTSKEHFSKLLQNSQGNEEMCSSEKCRIESVVDWPSIVYKYRKINGKPAKF